MRRILSAPFVLSALAVLIALAVLPTRADECDSEARNVESMLRAEGGSDLDLDRRVDRARLLCRDSPNAALSDLRDTRREIDLRAQRREPGQQQGYVPPPVGEPWKGAGPPSWTGN
jgi:hypothetical protein